MATSYTPIEEFDMFAKLEKLIDEIWDEVVGWDTFTRNTIGQQLVESADSMGANLVEGDGRYSHKEGIRFFHIARGSGREARFWIKRARARKLMTEERADDFTNRTTEVLRWINSLIRKRKEWIGMLREDTIEYLDSDDF